MLTLKDINEMEKLIGQLKGHHKELSALAKKSPNDGVNDFKLKFVNITLQNCNKLLVSKYKPFADFDTFDTDDLPSNSDVTFILSQYMESIEKMRSDNITNKYGDWIYLIKDSNAEIKSGPPAKLQGK